MLDAGRVARTRPSRRCAGRRFSRAEQAPTRPRTLSISPRRRSARRPCPSRRRSTTRRCSRGGGSGTSGSRRAPTRRRPAAASCRRRSGCPGWRCRRTARPEPSCTSHDQPEPNWLTPVSLTLAWKSANEPNAESIALGQRAVGLAAAVRAHALPEERVVVVAAAVVFDRVALVVGTWSRSQDLLDRRVGQRPCPRAPR